MSEKLHETEALLANKKLDELIGLLNSGKLDDDQKVLIQQRFNDAVQQQGTGSSGLFEPFMKLDNDASSRMDLADDLEFLLAHVPLDSQIAKKYLFAEKLKKIVQLVIAILLIIMGFSMIIIKAPPYFEMFTIYYFNLNDGVTLMDVISLLIVFSGIYLLISALLYLRRSENNGAL